MWKAGRRVAKRTDKFQPGELIEMNEVDAYGMAIDYWRSRSVPLLPPADPNEVTAVFAELGQPLSRDVLQLYTRVNGFAKDEMDCLWRLLPLDELSEINHKKRPKVVWFADYLYFSHMYGFQYVDANTSAVCVDYGGEEFPLHRVADSVEEFLRLYVNDPSQVEAHYLD